MSAPTGSLSSPDIVRTARRLRSVSMLLEIGLCVLVAASLAALASVRSWAYVPVWLASAGLGLLLVERLLAARALRGLLGPRRFAFHPTDLWVVLDEEAPYGMPSWTFDLGRPLFPVGPILIPGLLFLVLVLVQLMPLPAQWIAWLSSRQAETLAAGANGWRRLTVYPSDTLRGLAFLASALILHAVAGVVLDRRQAADRFRMFLAQLGLVLALVSLAVRASGTRLIYGLVAPRESDGNFNVYGPFVNRDHFAGYLLLVAPVALGLVARAFRRYSWRVGSRPNLRRWLVGLQSTEGTALLYAFLPALATVGALLAAASRGATLAFVGALALAFVFARDKPVRLALVAPAVLVVAALAWYSSEHLRERFAALPRDAPGRTIVWRDTLSRMGGLWIAGSGFNTFGPAMSRATAWTLPKGATPWSEPYETSVASAPRLGFRSHLGMPGLTWYREAHNDYLQVLVETGLPGLALVLWAAFAIMRSARGDPWLLAAVTGVLLHSLVDFDLQVCAVAVLFVTLAGLRAEPRGRLGPAEPETFPAAAEPPLPALDGSGG